MVKGGGRWRGMGEWVVHCRKFLLLLLLLWKVLYVVVAGRNRPLQMSIASEVL